MKSTRPITDFFKPFAAPKEYASDSSNDADEIAVAARFQPRQSTQQHPSTSDTEGASSSRKRPSTTADLSSSPSKWPKRRREKSTVLSLDGANDGHDPLLHSSSSVSSQRNLSAVQIPSPARCASPLSQPPPVPETNGSTAVTTSFTSVSSLSSNPPSTQSSSKRVIRHGLHAVTNSDSGSDSEDELADLNVLVPRKKMFVTPSGIDAAHAIAISDSSSSAKSGRKSARLSNQSGTSARSSSQLPRSPPQKTYKFSLAQMVKEEKKRAEQEDRIRQAEAEVLEAEKMRMERAVAAQSPDKRTQLLAFDGEAEDTERFLQAVLRTEALDDRLAFRFFQQPAVKAPNDLFPVEELPDAPWARLLKKDQTREQSCLSGFVRDLAGKGLLKQRVVLWFANQLVHETREGLLEAYIGIIHTHAESQRSKAPTDAISLRLLYATSSTDAMVVISNRDKNQEQDSLTSLPGLCYAIQAVQHTSVHQSLASITRTVQDLALASLDECIGQNMAAHILLHDAIETLLEKLDNDELANLARSTTSDVLEHLDQTSRFRLIAGLPATAAKAHRFRRMLALRVITQFNKDRPFTSATWAQLILQRLQDPTSHFHITDHTDYTLFSALIQILDIAIDAGFSDHSFITRQLEAPSTVAPDKVEEGSKPTGALFAPPPPKISEAEQAFNRQIDALVSEIKRIGNQIKDSGATHLKRTEAKAALERLVARLDSAVRTRPKSKKSLFGSSRDKRQINSTKSSPQKRKDLVATVEVHKSVAPRSEARDDEEASIGVGDGARSRPGFAGTQAPPPSKDGRTERFRHEATKSKERANDSGMDSGVDGAALALPRVDESANGVAGDGDVNIAVVRQASKENTRISAWAAMDNDVRLSRKRS